MIHLRFITTYVVGIVVVIVRVTPPLSTICDTVVMLVDTVIHVVCCFVVGVGSWDTAFVVDGAGVGLVDVCSGGLLLWSLDSDGDVDVVSGGGVVISLVSGGCVVLLSPGSLVDDSGGESLVVSDGCGCDDSVLSGDDDVSGGL